jgi:glycine/D-amino acid oxidase-like deaminating enzyme/nitrite reductase/ring-hydroxylating ferredoxin subunit
MQKNKITSSISLWRTETHLPTFSSLENDLETDVCVIGAGIAGLTTAYLLSQEGKKVLLIEANTIGSGETGRTTAHFFPPDEWYHNIENTFDIEHSILVADSFSKAVDLVESIIKKEHIECTFERVSGYLYSLSEKEHGEIEEEVNAARRAGVTVQKLEQVPGMNFPTGPCVQYANQAQFHPLKYLAGLANAFIGKGGQIYCDTRALTIDSDHSIQVISTRGGKIRAQAVVVATHTPFNDRVVMHTKQAAYMTYVIGIRVPKGSIPHILMWDTGDPYYYLRLETPEFDTNYDILVVGGRDHKVGQDLHPEHRYEEIEQWVRERFPMAQSVEYRWSGEIMEPGDGLAFLGHNPMDERNVYIITGDSGNGMTHCTIGAMIVTDLIMERPNPWASIYDPKRLLIHGISDFVSEQANTLAQYTDWLKGGEVTDIKDIPKGQGAVVQDGVRRIAVYKDDQGELYVLSAKCPHLGCIVHFNSAEGSWDCPCHGSRFDVTGEILHGPASIPLPKLHV